MEEAKSKISKDINRSFRKHLMEEVMFMCLYMGKTEGGIVTNDDELAEKCRTFSNHGALIKHQHSMEGINSRLDGLQAAILNAKLPHILDWTESRRSRAAYGKIGSITGRPSQITCGFGYWIGHF